MSISYIPPADRPRNMIIERVNNKAVDSDVAMRRVYLYQVNGKADGSVRYYIACAAIDYDAVADGPVTLYPLNDEEFIDAVQQRSMFIAFDREDRYYGTENAFFPAAFIMGPAFEMLGIEADTIIPMATGWSNLSSGVIAVAAAYNDTTKVLLD